MVGSTMLAILLILSVSLLFLRVGHAENNGGTFLAMAGKDSVLLATDSRRSSSILKGFLLDQRPRDLYKLGSRTLAGFYGSELCAGHVVWELQEMIKEHRDEELSPDSLARVVANILYKKGFPLCPIIVGLDDNDEAYICSMDGLGAQTKSKDFAVVGTANAEVLALCESLYRSGLEAEELLQLGGKCLQLAFQRNILSGGNIKVVVLQKGSKIISKILQFEDV